MSKIATNTLYPLYLAAVALMGIAFHYLLPILLATEFVMVFELSEAVIRKLPQVVVILTVGGCLVIGMVKRLKYLGFRWPFIFAILFLSLVTVLSLFIVPIVSLLLARSRGYEWLLERQDKIAAAPVVLAIFLFFGTFIVAAWSPV
ncbi:hypothetical protein [Vibrio barjaei]|uniref:hypothetical protein n=1 Tax=Vibrio barjaei TaxID=1676683 RepID=UPI002283E34C|nr:hypothetical protein [Vibrio barjaei]MCY9872998.1 hypothetical protein [Vibrio barjaei]